MNALNTGLVDPAVQGLTGDSNSVAQLADLLSITVNNQDVSDGTFTETAVEVRVLPGLTGGLGSACGRQRQRAQINLARASVGPNVVPGDVGGVDTTPPPTTETPETPAPSRRGTSLGWRRPAWGSPLSSPPSSHCWQRVPIWCGRATVAITRPWPGRTR